MKPTTPLPWKKADGHFQHVTGDDLDYIIHAANAYPGLVEILKVAIEVAELYPEQEKWSARWRQALLTLGEQPPPSADFDPSITEH